MDLQSMYSSPVGWCSSCNLLCASWEAARLPQTNNSIEGASSLGCLPVQALKLEQLCEAKEAENNTKAISCNICVLCNLNRYECLIIISYHLHFDVLILMMRSKIPMRRRKEKIICTNNHRNWISVHSRRKKHDNTLECIKIICWVHTCDLALTH